MAKSIFAPLLGALLLAGCQDQQSMVETLPAPTFEAPTLAAQQAHPVTAIKPPPLAHNEPAPPKVLQPKGLTGIPVDWAASVTPRPWRWIVIHHSDTAVGGAAAFDRFHKEKGWDELGYHFVIGNGSESGDGQVEVGPRWIKQKWGAHAKTPDNQFNDFGIGICLVGNFDNTKPTAAQLRSLSKLVAYLERTYRIDSEHVLGHRDTKSTDCPGRNMNVADVRRMASQLLVEAGEFEDVLPTKTASADLMHDAKPER